MIGFLQNKSCNRVDFVIVTHTMESAAKRLKGTEQTSQSALK